MNRYYYDLHIHSCLSPCGDNDSTPDSIVGMGELNGLDIMALTDHNSCKNCPAFFKAAERHSVTAVAGMELTTAEDIHVVCLFEALEGAMDFDSQVKRCRILIPNKSEVFGDQLIMDDEDNIIGSEENLLINATTISLEQVPALCAAHGGICYPAHIDRESNGVIAVLGTFPIEPRFSFAELHNRALMGEFIESTGLNEKSFIVSSDAHYLWDIKEKTDYFTLDADKDSVEIRKSLFRYLRGAK